MSTTTSSSSDSSFSFSPSILGQYGLILINASDPISWISNVVTEIPYTLLGFYYKTRDNSKHNVIIKNVFTCSTPSWFNNCTFSDILSSPIVESIQVRPMIDISDVKSMDNYIISVMMDLISIDETDSSIIFNILFNSNSTEHVNVPLYPIINKKILDITTKYYSYTNPNAEVVQDINLNVNKVILSPIWMEAIDINTREFTNKEISAARINCYRDSHDLIDLLGQQFIQLLFDEPELIILINNRRKGKLRDIHINLIKELIDTINNSFSESYLNLSETNNILENINQKLQLDNIPIQFNIQKLSSRLIFIDSSSELDEITTHHDYTQSFQELGDELRLLKRCVNSPVNNSLNINKLFDLYNSLQSLTKIGRPIKPLTGVYSSSISIFVSDNGNESITFRHNEKVIMIHSRYYELDQFTNDELYQILVAIDNQVKENLSYVFDSLRMAIIDRLY